jgi:hypothetical protein
VKSGVPLFGKPDVFFMNAEGAHVVFDWKVNGYCSKSAVSPAPGYKRIRDTWDWREGDLSRNSGDAHRDYIPLHHKGVEINGFCYLEQVNSGLGNAAWRPTGGCMGSEWVWRYWPTSTRSSVTIGKRNGLDTSIPRAKWFSDRG